MAQHGPKSMVQTPTTGPYIVTILWSHREHQLDQVLTQLVNSAHQEGSSPCHVAMLPCVTS